MAPDNPLDEQLWDDPEQGEPLLSPGFHVDFDEGSHEVFRRVATHLNRVRSWADEAESEAELRERQAIAERMYHSFWDGIDYILWAARPHGMHVYPTSPHPACLSFTWYDRRGDLSGELLYHADSDDEDGRPGPLGRWAIYNTEP